jgi:hypothetical protein
MTTCDLPSPVSPSAASSAEALHQLKDLARRDPSFAADLLDTASTQVAMQLASRRGIAVSPEALWRHRGTLLPGGLPTWRG